MFRNRWTWIAALAILGCALFAHFAVVSTRPGITLSNFGRLELGATRAQAEELLGGPPSAVAPNGRQWIGLLFL
jgi:hypothetical protein